MNNLEGQTIVMMGASGGIGSATAMKIAKPGVNLAICASKPERLEKLKEKIIEKGANVYSETVDLCNVEAINNFMLHVYQKFGQLNVLINFAGLSVTAKIDQLTEADYNKVMDVNVKGMFFSTKAFVNYVNEEKGALIINFGSMASKRPNPNAPHYSAAKAAVNMFTESLAQQLKPKNIRMTAINPGPTNTSFFDGRVPEDKRTDFMNASDVAEIIEFILTRNDNINIHDIMVDSFAFYKR